MSLPIVVDSRRLVRAAAFALVVFVLVGGGVGFVVASGDDGPSALHLPEPFVNDRATYKVMGHNLRNGVTWDAGEVVYEWQPERILQDDGFAPRFVHPLRADYHFLADGQDLRFVTETSYDAASRLPLSKSMPSQEVTQDGVFIGFSQPLRPLPEAPIVEDMVFELYAGAMGPCGAWTAAHGAAVEAGLRSSMPGTCLWRFDGDDSDADFVAQGWGTSKGWSGRSRHAFRFDSVEDDRFRVWYDDASPFPARVQSSFTELLANPELAGRLVFQLERVSASRGVEPYPPPQELAPGPGPVPLTAPTPWALDDAWVDSDLPLRDAYQAALEQDPPLDLPTSLGPRTPTVGEWLGRHPEGYLGFATALEYRNVYDERTPEWILLWVDGKETLGKRVSLTSAEGGVQLPQAAGRRVEITAWVPSWLPDGYTFPPRASLPAQVPDLRAMADRYRLLQGPDAAINRYGFQYACFWTCDDVRVLAEVGYHSEDPAGSDAAIDPASALLEKLMVGNDGQIVYRLHYVETQDAIVPLAASPSDQEPAPDGGGRHASAGWALADAPAAATGVGLVALLAGLLYYFWPAAKGLPVLGLFSRIREDRVLDHPQRSRILDLLRAEPGLHFQEMSRRLAMGHGVLDHHLRKLVDADLVVVRRSPGYTCYFPKATDRRMMDAAPVLRSGGSRLVLGAVADKPGVSSRDLAVHLGLAPSTVSYHLKRLETAGLVLPDPRAGVRLTPLGEQAKAAA